MSLNKELLELLACPQCKGVVRYEVPESRLVCEPCRLGFPIRDEIPVMLMDEAETL
ncbi:MAG: Trm112 family protein [Desulfuromonadales bacterium]|nr:Trm112 family protein [Desulfuromonadales bacterium]MDW7756458.1 Trm112 family protein [Desulfuromonadales bacterium]